MQPIKKAVFPVAGIGSRFLPATKANPKEMLPIVDKPLIQYAVEEAISAGVEELIFVTSSSKRAIEDHFDANYELEQRLAQAGKQDLLAIVRNVLPSHVQCAYVRQQHPLGLGHAVLCAKRLVGDEPFAVLLADDLIDGGDVPCLVQMVKVAEQTQNSVIAVQRIPQHQTGQHGIVAVADASCRQQAITAIVEKPQPEDAPSDLAVVGRYILTPDIFHCLENTPKGTDGEIQLTDAIAHLLTSQPVQALQFSGTRYDCGNKLGYLQATVAYGLRHPEVGDDFRAFFLDSLIKP